jgi:hypothetical protein
MDTGYRFKIHKLWGNSAFDKTAQTQYELKSYKYTAVLVKFEERI